MQSPAEIPLEKVFEALLDTDTPLNPRYLYRLSDLEPNELKEIGLLWKRLPEWRRLGLMEDIEQINDSDTLLSFEELARFAIKDEDPKVRVVSARILLEYDRPDLVPVFLEMLRTDAAVEARAAAANSLGQYVYLGELEELPQKMLKRIEDALLEKINGEDETEVRRMALEALGYSSREEVAGLIEKAFASADKNWKASALYAMGRSADRVWKPQVMEMLHNPHPILRAEAARAAGELELREAAPILNELIDDPDESTRHASIWSLTQIGGSGVSELLQRLYDRADSDDELEFIEEAIDNLGFTEGVQMMPIIDLAEGEADDDEDEDEDWYEEVDLEDEADLEEDEFDEDDDEDSSD